MLCMGARAFLIQQISLPPSTSLPQVVAQNPANKDQSAKGFSQCRTVAAPLDVWVPQCVDGLGGSTSAVSTCNG